MLPETVARLSELGSIIGVKEATGDLERIRRLRELCDDAFIIISGDDETSMETLFNGGRGVITVTGNVAPKLMHEMCQAALDGDEETARAPATASWNSSTETCSSSPTRFRSNGA